MHATQLRRRLDAIRSRYNSVHEITSRLGLNPAQESLDTALTQRAIILADLVPEQIEVTRELGSVDRTSSEAAAIDALVDEIHGTVESICALDIRLEKTVRGRMDDNREELRSLYHSSRAARAYTVSKGY